MRYVLSFLLTCGPMLGNAAIDRHERRRLDQFERRLESVLPPNELGCSLRERVRNALDHKLEETRKEPWLGVAESQLPLTGRTQQAFHDKARELAAAVAVALGNAVREEKDANQALGQVIARLGELEIVLGLYRGNPHVSYGLGLARVSVPAMLFAFGAESAIYGASTHAEWVALLDHFATSLKVIASGTSALGAVGLYWDKVGNRLTSAGAEFGRSRRAEAIARTFWGSLAVQMRADPTLSHLLPEAPGALLKDVFLMRLNYVGDGVAAGCSAWLEGISWPSVEDMRSSGIIL